MAKKKTVGSTTTKKSVEVKTVTPKTVIDHSVVIDRIAQEEGFNCRHDTDGYTLNVQFELMDMRIYFNKDLDLVRFTTAHSYPTVPEYITAKNVFKRHLFNILEKVNIYKNSL